MEKSLGLSFFILLSTLYSVCLGQNSNESKVEVYYFHYTQRCATCLAVENETKNALENLYPKEFEEGKINFASYNLEKEEGEIIAQKLRVSGQTLLIKKGDKQENITSIGFMYAKSNPEILQEKIKEIINSF